VAADASVFFALWVHDSLRIAAVEPGRQRLAHAIAAAVDLSRSDPALELGAGTVGLTLAPIRGGCPAERMIALEREPELAAIRSVRA
jgi:phospholipid N-methyltransferase